MDKRTKILAGVFGLFVAGMLYTNFVYPEWVEPLLHIDDRIADKQKEYDELSEGEDAVAEGKYFYRDCVARIGSFDVGVVEVALRGQLNDLLDRHNFTNANVSRSRPSKDRKTGLTRMVVTVSASGPLKSALGFLKDVAEISQLVRVGNVLVTPASKGRRAKARGKRRSKEELVSIKVPIEALVLPQHKLVGRLDPSKLTLAKPFAPRHHNNAYATIWEATPFSEYVPPVPLRVNGGRAVNVVVGRQASLGATVTGGDGEYTYQWTPSEYLSDPTSLKPKVDTKVEFTETYTLTATDGDGATASGTVRVVVKKKAEIVRRGGDNPPPPPPAPVKRGPTRWKDGKYMELRMALMHSAGPSYTGEVMVYNNRKRGDNYYRIDDEFDGGKLVYVHPTGGLVRRSDEYFIYPIGARVDEDLGLDAETAREYPQLLDVGMQMKAHDAEQAELDAEVAAKKKAAAEAARKKSAAAKPGIVTPKQSPAAKPNANTAKTVKRPGAAAARRTPSRRAPKRGGRNARPSVPRKIDRKRPKKKGS